MGTKELKRSREKSIQQIKEINYQYLVQKMADYFEIVDYGKTEISPFQKAELLVAQKKRAGFLDDFNCLRIA